MEEIARRARDAANVLQCTTSEHKTATLKNIYKILKDNKNKIFEENEKDLAEAQRRVDQGELSASLFKRLDIKGKDGGKFEEMLSGIKEVENLEDPIGKTTLAKELDAGLELYRVTCAVGVILVIFEARPEVVVNIACLAIKTGNAAILKGGKEAQYTNRLLAKLIGEAVQAAKKECGGWIPEDAVQLVETREQISELLEQDEYIDLVIPRGSNSLVKYIKNSTRIPVLGHADGICSIYLDESADVEKAKRIVVDAKTSYTAACNAAETLLVNENLLKNEFLQVAKELIDNNVLLRLDARTYEAVDAARSELGINSSSYVQAHENDFHTEFLSLEIAVKSVSSVQEAIRHINTHGSKHTDAIVTENKENADLFMKMVDAAGVYWNASTRFADGFRYSFGTEVGVSTNKTHARGPVGLEGLTIYKYKLYGNGHIVGNYGTGPGKRSYTHKNIPF
ncbi:Gamma-glutamyl phosphate reductase [Zancudomyces culisetae]|uniref:glutamate-5-semialdehyde dehydrogenase n=1 Tax=Zancudomyces culisetae TaxID=1213189 RepID=A0A1R1PML6_ZANCU|nr:Gamma-glutamyl phosphate reductase [Zancudomyces culisetae]|eukprot:OMH82204.1 Gamma-glutamyl phosphate reductase [Zancudomyces culisetae]